MEKSFSDRVAEAVQAVTSISPRQAAALQGKQGVTFVDPRPAAAIAKSTGIIPGASNVALDDIVSGALPPELADRSRHVITSCQGGPMGAIAAHELLRLGFTRVNYVEGGTQGWLDAGLPTNR